MFSRNKLISVFEDTIKWINTNKELSESVDNSINNTMVYFEDNYPEYTKKFDKDTVITVSKDKSFQATMRLSKDNPDKKIAVLNFANSVHPGGGVTRGARAQEESLCRTSTLYPVIMDQISESYYAHHRKLNDKRATDSLIYSENIIICKTDDDIPKRMPKKDWVNVDIITMAAPHLAGTNGYGLVIDDSELFDIHLKRALHMLTVAAHKNVDILVLGAFGCGAFNNNPDVVSKAYKQALEQFNGAFEKVEFAIFCAEHETNNYLAFKKNIV